MKKVTILVLIMFLLTMGASAWADPEEPEAIAAPSNLSGEYISSLQVNLSWEDNSDNESGFMIERKTGSGSYTQIGTVGANATYFSDTGLATNTTYSYRVKAYNNETESGYSNVFTVTITGTPAAPAGLSATAESSSRITLTWSDNSNNETGFKIERKVAGGSYTQIATVGADSTTFSNSGLANNTKYYYRVRAYNALGNSGYSNEASATTGSVPAAPSNLTAAAESSSKIKLTWSDNANNELGFTIEMRTAGESYTQIAAVGANTTTFTSTGLANNTKYYFRVRAYNLLGDSAYSNEAGATTGTIPAAPSDLEATVESPSKIKLTWSDNSNNESGFKIERKKANGSYTQIATVGANVSTYTNTGLTEDTRYYYRVRAYNVAGNSSFSNEASANTGYYLTAPANLTATAESSSRIKLTWSDKSDNESGFRIERKTASGSYSQIATVGANTTTYTNTGLSENTRYYYRVRAYNSSENSAYSNEASATTRKIETIINLTIGKSSYYVNDQLKTMDTAPIIKDSRTLLPIRYVAEALGATVSWNSKEQKVAISLKGTTIELWIGKNTARVNGEYRLIDSTNPDVRPIIIEPGRTMLPLRFVSENLGCKVDWNQSTQKVTVTYPAP